MGMAFLSHFTYGAIWAAIFVLVVDDVSIWKGLIFGTIVWLIVQIAVLPILGWGIFGKKVTMKIAVATLVLHLVYGGVTAWMAVENPVV